MTEHEHDTGVERMDAKTVEALYELVKDVPERQIDGGAALDTKMVQIFSAASIVIGLTALSFSGAPDPASLVAGSARKKRPIWKRASTGAQGGPSMRRSGNSPAAEGSTAAR